MAGGQSLIPLMKLRFASVGTVVDINRVAGLDAIEERTVSSASARSSAHAQAERSPLLTERYGLLGEHRAAGRRPARPEPRDVCGSLAHADPQGDWGAAMLAARGERRRARAERRADDPGRRARRSARSRRTLAAGRDRSPRCACPIPGPRTGGTYLKLERKIGDFATAAVAVQVTLDNGNVGQVGIGLTGVGADEPARERGRGRASRQPSRPTTRSARPPRSPPRPPTRNPTTAAARSTRGTSCACSASAAFALRSRPPRPARSDGHDPARIAHDGRPPHRPGHRQRAATLRATSSRGCCSSHFLRETLGLTGTHIGCDTTSCGACTVLVDGDAGEVLHDARRPGERRRDHDRRGARRRAASCTRSRRPSTRSTACSAGSARRG